MPLSELRDQRSKDRVRQAAYRQRKQQERGEKQKEESVKVKVY